MAPKRKAAGSPATKPATKRSAAATTSNAKTRSSKAIESIQLDSSDEEEIPAKKKPAPAKRAPKKPAVSKATPAAPPSVEAPTSTSTTPVPDATAKKSTSKAKVAAKPAVKPRASPAKPPAKKKVVVPPKPKDWETLCREMFEQFALAGEEDEDDEEADDSVVKAGAPPERMEGGGIQKLFEEMNIGMEGIQPFLLAYKLKAAAFGSFSLKEWMDGFRAEQIGTTAGIKTTIVELEKSLYPSSAALAALPSYLRSTSRSEFKKFYVFLFNLLREEGQKSLGAEIALAIWGVVLKDYRGKTDGVVTAVEQFDDEDDSDDDEEDEMARAKLASMRDVAVTAKGDSGSDDAGGKLIQEFIEYGTSLGPKFKGVSSDVWNQLLDFLDCVGPDLTGYEDDSAWPSMLDSFVEWKRERDAPQAK